MTKRISIKVTPCSAKNEIIGFLPDGTLKVKITAAPTDGEANKTLLAFLSKEWKIPKSKISIKSGHTSRMKILEIIE